MACLLFLLPPRSTSQCVQAAIPCRAASNRLRNMARSAASMELPGIIGSQIWTLARSGRRRSRSSSLKLEQRARLCRCQWHPRYATESVTSRLEQAGLPGLITSGGYLSLAGALLLARSHIARSLELSPPTRRRRLRFIRLPAARRGPRHALRRRHGPRTW